MVQQSCLLIECALFNRRTHLLFGTVRHPIEQFISSYSMEKWKVGTCVFYKRISSSYRILIILSHTLYQTNNFGRRYQKPSKHYTATHLTTSNFCHMKGRYLTLLSTCKRLIGATLVLIKACTLRSTDWSRCT